MLKIQIIHQPMGHFQQEKKRGSWLRRRMSKKKRKKGKKRTQGSKFLGYIQQTHE
jgi:hypothetical protein